jgi:ABC-type nitrate/sulfonate/bicarbonate transport system ATPase subunit
MSQSIGISVQDVAFGYDNKPIFESINFEVPIGKMWALVGRSGVGKTTLLQIISGLFCSSHGSVTVAERNQEGTGRIKGVVFQDESLLGWLSVEQNLLFPNHKQAAESAKSKAHKILIEVGLSGFENALPATLSTGMRKRVEFARAILVDDQYLLADEPFGPLDALTRRDLWRIWQVLRKSEPRTGILSTHDPEEALRLCDVVVPLVPGPPAHLGTPIVVPPYFSTLSPSESNGELIAFKEQLIHGLELTGDAQ